MESTVADAAPLYDAVVLSGGGTKVLASLGALHYFYENELISNDSIKDVAGTSAGALSATLLAIGYTPIEIFRQEYYSKSIFDLNYINSISEIRKGMGLMKIGVLRKKLNEYIHTKIPSVVNYDDVPSIKDVLDTYNKNLIIAATNETKGKAEYFTTTTHPDCKIDIAACLSSCLPFVFEKTSYKGDTYVDGGLSDNFPLGQIPYHDTPRRILGIIVENSTPKETPSNEGMVQSFLNYVFKLIDIPIHTITELRSLERRVGDNVDIIRIVHNSNLLDTGMSPKDKMDLFKAGYEQAFEFHAQQKKKVMLSIPIGDGI